MLECSKCIHVDLNFNQYPCIACRNFKDGFTLFTFNPNHEEDNYSLLGGSIHYRQDTKEDLYV